MASTATAAPSGPRLHRAEVCPSPLVGRGRRRTLLNSRRDDIAAGSALPFPMFSLWLLPAFPRPLSPFPVLTYPFRIHQPMVVHDGTCES